MQGSRVRESSGSWDLPFLRTPGIGPSAPILEIMTHTLYFLPGIHPPLWQKYNTRTFLLSFERTQSLSNFSRNLQEANIYIKVSKVSQRLSLMFN